MIENDQERKHRRVDNKVGKIDGKSGMVSTFYSFIPGHKKFSLRTFVTYISIFTK